MYNSEPIRIAMVKQRITGEQLAIKARVSRPTVSAIVNEKPVTLASLKAVADALGLNLEELFAAKDTEEIEPEAA